MMIADMAAAQSEAASGLAAVAMAMSICKHVESFSEKACRPSIAGTSPKL
jgi:hypothetical protein